MGFQSFTFFYFLFACLIVVYAVPPKFKWVVLLTGSSLFIASFIPYSLLVIGALTCLNYCLGIFLNEQKYRLIHKKIFLIGVSLNILSLLIFKYLGFLEINVNQLGQYLHWNYSLPLLKIVVPIGFSFLVFQMISYLIEVKRKNIQAEKNLGIFMLYALWFPKIMSGPIERPGTLLPQFRNIRNTQTDYIVLGFRQIVWGFFQKLVIADRLAMITSPVFDQPGVYSGFSIVVAVILYSFQIYADFAGYTDIALGVSQLFGIKLTANFRTPYFSKSIQDFWTRWHITLSSWLRDYLFLPISYSVSRKLFKDKYLEIDTEYWIYGIASLVTMLICGIWHGAGFTFIVWGLLHGVYLISGFILKKWKKKINKILGWKKDNRFRSAWDIVFSFTLVSFAWIFFRSVDMTSAKYMILSMFSIPNWLNSAIIHDLTEFKITIALLMVWIAGEWFYKKTGFLEAISKLQIAFRWTLYFILIWSIVIFGQFGNERFIYFQF